LPGSTSGEVTTLSRWTEGIVTPTGYHISAHFKQWRHESVQSVPKKELQGSVLKYGKNIGGVASACHAMLSGRAESFQDAPTLKQPCEVPLLDIMGECAAEAVYS